MENLLLDPTKKEAWRMVKLKTIFLGTPALSIPFLKLLSNYTEVLMVITQPDRPSGRHLVISSPAIKLFAQENEIPVFQPVDLKNHTFLAQLANKKIELGVVVSYGKILPKQFLTIPEKGFINVHFSLLPKYRGAAPIQWSIINGEKETGVTVFRLEEGMDTGKILVQKPVSIDDDDTVITLEKKLIASGLGCLQESIELISSGRDEYQPQTGEPTYAPLLKKEDGRIRWLKPAEEIYNLVRGTQPWPGAYTTINQPHLISKKVIKILESKPIMSESNLVKNNTAGQILEVSQEKGILVNCGSGCLSILQLQEEGKKPLSAWQYWQGARIKIGDIFE